MIVRWTWTVLSLVVLSAPAEGQYVQAVQTQPVQYVQQVRQPIFYQQPVAQVVQVAQPVVVQQQPSVLYQYAPSGCPPSGCPTVVVQVPPKDAVSELLTQQLQQQVLTQSLGLGGLGFGGMGGIGGLGGGSGGVQQQMQMMAMMHMMQSQGMSYYQQMQMIAMMQMAKRMGGTSVPLQPIFRTTAEYKYPGKKVIFWPPYISTQRKEPPAGPPVRPTPPPYNPATEPPLAAKPKPPVAPVVRVTEAPRLEYDFEPGHVAESAQYSYEKVRPSPLPSSAQADIVRSGYHVRRSAAWGRSQ